jgi:serine/threonine-protein kinase
MGEVFEAHDPIIDRPVAIKMLRPELIERGDAVGWFERFRREARAAGRRLHPNIVTILDCGDQNGAPFLAMEYIEGESVDAALKRSGRLSPRYACAIITQVLSALEFAHANGVIHRDIKPSNILISASGPIKVADFGIAHVEASELTIDGDILGTPSYMAPEQLSGAAVDHRADLFAAGVVFFEMLTGMKPFRGRSVLDLARAMQTGATAEIWEDTHDVTPSLRAVIDKALAADPDQRYANAADFARAVFETRLTVENETPPPGSAVPPDATVVLRPSSEATEVTPSSGTTAFNSDVLAGVERDLSTFMGPMARIAVRRATTLGGDLDQLYLELAKHIDREIDRAAFLTLGRRRATGLAASRGASSPTPSGQTSPRSPGGNRPRTTPAEPMTADLGPDALSRIEAGLAEYIGPIARILVKQQLSKSASVIDLCRELSLYIPDERDRARFLSAQRMR